jgi:ribonucleotide monophosphatase NagD (HAD superfamily)
MLCANPDIVRVSPEGTVAAPGALARRYEELGGRVFYHGKPYPAIYATCLQALKGCERERVIAIGDSIEHDIVGAARAGLACAFVVGGIHAQALVDRWGELPDPSRWRAFIANAAARPQYLLPALVW